MKEKMTFNFSQRLKKSHKNISSHAQTDVMVTRNIRLQSIEVHTIQYYERFQVVSFLPKVDYSRMDTHLIDPFVGIRLSKNHFKFYVCY